MMSKYKNESKYKKAIQEYNADKNMTLTDISNKYGFDRACLSRYMKSQGIEIRKTNKSKENSDRYDKAEELYKQGLSINQIYEITGVNKKNFSLYLKSQSIDIRNGFKKVDYIVNDNYFESIDSEDKAYWLGFIYADGCVVSKNRTYRLTIELNNIDRLHLEKFKQSIASDVEIKNRKNRPTSSVTINRKKITEDLNQYGCVPNKTENGTINLEMINGYERDFLRGYLDGDGFIEKNYKKYRIIYTVKSRQITEALTELLFEFNPRIENCETFYRIHIEQKENFFALLSYLYENSNTYLNRKYYTYLDRIHAVLGQSSQET